MGLCRFNKWKIIINNSKNRLQFNKDKNGFKKNKSMLNN